MQALVFALLLGAILPLAACGHTHAATPEVPMDVVMQTVRDYGHGHPSSPSSTSAPKPTETDQHYCSFIHDILLKGDFAQLEKIAHEDRTEKGRLLGGIWKINGFYGGAGAASCTSLGKDASYPSQIALLKKWAATYPDSPTPRIALATLYLNYAWLARGTGHADTVSDQGWQLFQERLAQTKAMLLEAAPLKEKDPYWFELMLNVAQDEGWEQADARELFNRAVAFEPDYYHYYRRYANYLLPEWNGKPGDIAAFAEEVAQNNPGPDGSMYYFLIASSIACYCKSSLREMQTLSYPAIRDGYNVLVQRYGVTNLNANRFAFFASMFADKDSARPAFVAITKVDDEIWTNEQMYDMARQWATAP